MDYESIHKVEIHADCISTIPCVHTVSIHYVDGTSHTLLKSGELILDMIKQISDGRRKVVWLSDSTNGHVPWITVDPVEHFAKYHEFTSKNYKNVQQQEYMEIIEEFERAKNETSMFLSNYPNDIKDTCCIDIKNVKNNKCVIL